MSDNQNYSNDEPLVDQEGQEYVLWEVDGITYLLPAGELPPDEKLIRRWNSCITCLMIVAVLLMLVITCRGGG